MSVVRIPTVPNPHVVEVSPAAGEYLHFSIEADGGPALFSFATSTRGILFEATDFLGHPRRRYEWEHLRNRTDFQHFEHLDVALTFSGTGIYRYVVQLRRMTGGGSTVLDIAYAGKCGDTTAESLTLQVMRAHAGAEGLGAIAERLHAPRPAPGSVRSLPWWPGPSRPSS